MYSIPKRLDSFVNTLMYYYTESMWKKFIERRNPNPFGKEYLANWGPIRFLDVIGHLFDMIFQGAKESDGNDKLSLIMAPIRVN